MQKSIKYDNSSIDMLTGAERIRKRPASMLGDNGLAGARHGFTEIYGNALDEATSGYGNKLEVTYYRDGSISLRDYGRGVPLGWNEGRKSYNWHIIYNELYGGGKYDNNQWYLRSIENWAEWERDDNTLIQPVRKHYNVDLREIEDGGEKEVGVLLVKAENGKLYTRVKQLDWRTATWEFLNSQLNYLASVGLNGLGSASTQYTSEYFRVKSYRDGVCTEMNFEGGYPVFNGKKIDLFNGNKDIKEYPPKEYATEEENGTFIHWKPDNLVFTDTDIGGDWLYETCQDISNIANIELRFVDESKDLDIILPAGNLEQLARERNSELKETESGDGVIYKASNYNHGNIKVEGKDFVWVCKVDTTIALADEEENEVSCYHNAVKMQGGSQYNGVHKAITKFMNERSKSSNIKLQYSDYCDSGIKVYVSSYSNHASFRNQTKDDVQDDFIEDLVEKTVYETLSMEYQKGDIYLSELVDGVIEKAKERLSAKYLAKVSKEVKKMSSIKSPEKFVSCKDYEQKKYHRTELWITEGDSAKGSVKNARDRQFQAIYPIRGKGLNVLKSSVDSILKNEEIKNLFALIGTGFDINLKNIGNTFDINKLKFNKIIFATDADEDGYQIRVLLFLVFYKLAPELLRAGHIYIAETPRFQIVLKNGESVYALNDKERDEYLEKNGGNVKAINRFKGLGEVDADVLNETTVNPVSRNLVQLSCDFENKFECDIIEALFGADKNNQRKRILTNILGGDVADSFEKNSSLFDELDSTEFEEELEIEVV